jgi:hypothetical protein
LGAVFSKECHHIAAEHAGLVTEGTAFQTLIYADFDADFKEVRGALFAPLLLQA